MIMGMNWVDLRYTVDWWKVEIIYARARSVIWNWYGCRRIRYDVDESLRWIRNISVNDDAIMPRSPRWWRDLPSCLIGWSNRQRGQTYFLFSLIDDAGITNLHSEANGVHRALLVWTDDWCLSEWASWSLSSICLLSGWWMISLLQVMALQGWCHSCLQRVS